MPRHRLARPTSTADLSSWVGKAIYDAVESGLESDE